MTMIDLFQTKQKSSNNFIIMISILQAWLKTKASVCSKEYASTLGNSRKYPYPTTDGFHVSTPPCLRKFQNVLPPPPPMPSEFHNREPPLPFRISVFLEVHFRLSNAYMNKRTWIYASSRLWSSGPRWQALLFSDKKNLPLVARLCKLLFRSEFGYKNKHH